MEMQGERRIPAPRQLVWEKLNDPEALKQAIPGCDSIEAAGGTMDDICRVDVYIRNMEQFEPIHRVRREYFREPLPASTMVEVTKMTSPDALIEINAIAVIAD